MGFNRRNPKPETRNRQRKLVSSDETRNPKPETRNRQRKLVSIDETRNPKPETQNPKPTRIRLLGGSPDRNSDPASKCSIFHVIQWMYVYQSIHTSMNSSIWNLHVRFHYIDIYINTNALIYPLFLYIYILIHLSMYLFVLIIYQSYWPEIITVTNRHHAASSARCGSR